MAFYEPKLEQVEAFKRADGSYVADFGDGMVAMSAEDFEGAYRPVRARRGGGAAGRKVKGTRKAREGATAAEPAADEAAARRSGRQPQPWTCKKCGHGATGRKCQHCGADKYRAST